MNVVVIWKYIFFCRPEPPEEAEVEEEVAEDESELLLERVEEEMAAETLSDDEPDDNLLRVDDLRSSTKVSTANTNRSHEYKIMDYLTLLSCIRTCIVPRRTTSMDTFHYHRCSDF
jgi:hypothetical protein